MPRWFEQFMVWSGISSFGRCGLCNRKCGKDYAEIKYRVASHDEDECIESMRICTLCTQDLEHSIHHDD